MKATNFTRTDCQLGDKRMNYFVLIRDYRCQKCSGAIAIKSYADESTGWLATCWAECGLCGAQDFIHTRELVRQQQQAVEVLDGLPPQLAAAMGFEPLEKGEPVLFRLHSEPIDI